MSNSSRASSDEITVRSINCRGRQLKCSDESAAAVIMGILNVTPDSFSDGGRFMRMDEALRRVEEMVYEGATIIDVGGESSRPTGRTYGEGARPITNDEEIRRVVPIIEAILSRFPDTFVSVDSYKPVVIKAALDAGAHIINDITGLRYNVETAEIAAAAQAPLIVMHSVGTPGALPQEVEHANVVETVRSSLSRSVDLAREAGVADVIVDPGFGFGKSVTDNLRLLKHVDQFTEIAGPVMVGISRKSTIGQVLERGGIIADVPDRLFGTLGATAVAVLNGASIVRTHDIQPTADLLRAITAIASS
ncbi:MAG: dihydropteroate synthase [Rhodothermia bacterium]|nr:dihydropteroate synthase [Rhodothermia bacterium]